MGNANLESPDDKLKRVYDQIDAIYERTRPTPKRSTSTEGTLGCSGGGPDSPETEERAKRTRALEEEKKRRDGESDSAYQDRLDRIMYRTMSNSEINAHIAAKQELAILIRKRNEGRGTLVETVTAPNKYGVEVPHAKVTFQPIISEQGNYLPNSDCVILIPSSEVYATWPEYNERQIAELKHLGKDPEKPKVFAGESMNGLSGKLYFRCTDPLGLEKTWFFLIDKDQPTA